MHHLISVITAFYVLVHGIFGCCGDLSAHAGQASCSSAVAQSDEVPTHHHGSTEPPCQGSHSAPGTPHECVHASCQWLNARTVCADELFHTDWNQPALLSETASEFTSAEAASPSLCIDPPGRFAAHTMRLHLAISVLLI